VIVLGAIDATWVPALLKLTVLAVLFEKLTKMNQSMPQIRITRDKVSNIIIYTSRRFLGLLFATYM
jgi:hypothetical protein